MTYHKIKNEPDIIKDTGSGAVININQEAYDNYITAKKKRDMMNNRINNIENELGDIKNLLKQLLNSQG